MKKILFILAALMLGATGTTMARDNIFSRLRSSKAATQKMADNSTAKADSIYESVSSLYSKGIITADSVVSLAVYHKTGSPSAAEKCLKLVDLEKNPRAMTELGALYAFTPGFAAKSEEGVSLLEKAAAAGFNDANAYLGLYFFNKGDQSQALKYFEACRPMNFGFGFTALGSMYMTGNGVEKNIPKARDFFGKAALKGYPRGMALYGFNLRASGGGKIDYPDSFFWLYIAGDLGENSARTTLYLPMRKEQPAQTKEGQDAQAALQLMEAVQTVKRKNMKNDPLYKEGFLASLKTREKEAEQGDDWARYYLGSMNYNGDFLQQNYAQALRYYEPISKNGKLPRTVLAVVNERLAQMYRDGKGTKSDPVKAAHYARLAAKNGSLAEYNRVEGFAGR